MEARLGREIAPKEIGFLNPAHRGIELADQVGHGSPSPVRRCTGNSDGMSD